MSRIQPLTNPTGEAADLLGGLNKAIGKDLNIFTTMAHSPATLKSYMDFSGNLKKGLLDTELRELIALTCAGFNGCDYCASAHAPTAQKLGFDEETIKQALKGQHTHCEKGQAALTFTTALLKNNGHVSDDDFNALKTAGFNDGEIVEIIANVSLNIFTNYFNDVVQTAIDFDVVKANDCCGSKTNCCAA